MNAKEITLQNISNNGYRVGKAVKGKGYELFDAEYNFFYFWGRTNNEKIKSFKEKLQNADINSLYISDIYYINGKAEKRQFQYASLEIAQSQVSLKELIASNLEGVSEAQIKYRPSKLLGYFPISKYTSDLDSQKEMIIELLRFEGKGLYSDELFDYDDEWAYDDDIMSFDSKGYNGDYGLVHGSSYYMEDTDECKYVNGSLKYRNSMIVNDFWELDYEECFKSHFEELDPKDKICVYYQGGEDWYVGYQYDSQEMMISYRDEHGEICEDEFYALCYEKDAELVKKFVDILKLWRDDLSAKSYIYNELEIGEDFSSDYYNDEVVNQTLVELVYEDKNDLRDEIMESIKSWELETIKEEFARAYNAAIDSKIQVKDDLSVQITNIPMRMVSNPKSPGIKNYNHLKLIKRLEKRYGYELVQTSISSSLDMVQWAIKQGDEEYHFEITDVIAYDIDGTQTLKEFIVEVLGALEKRKLEKISQAKLFEKASHVFIGISDSIQAGNCQSGTNQFIRKHHIDTQRIGGIRGDVLLEMENSVFTKRAVNHAIITHEGLAS